jgi:hypothetical protein
MSWVKLTLQVASQVAVTDTLGQLTTAAFLPVGNGGMGFAYTPTTLDIQKVLQVNPTGTALTLDTVPSAPSVKMYLWNHFL